MAYVKKANRVKPEDVEVVPPVDEVEEEEVETDEEQGEGEAEEEAAKPKPNTPADRIAQLENTVSELTRLIRAQNASVKPKPDLKSTCKMRVYTRTDKDGNETYFPVIGYGKTRPIGDDGRTFSLKITLGNKGVKEPEEVDYLSFMNDCPAYVCELIETKLVPGTDEFIPQGSVNNPIKLTTRVADQLAKKTSQGHDFVQREIILTHQQPKYMARVRFVEGPLENKELTVEADCLNK